MPLSPLQIDVTAQEYNDQAEIVEREAGILHSMRERIIAEVEKHGATPARAIKSKALPGNRYELRVSYPAEVTVDTAAALTILRACRRANGSRLFMRLFHRVTVFRLANGAHKVMETLPKNSPRNLRGLFARALRIRELTPQLEVRDLQGKSKKEEAAA